MEWIPWVVGLVAAVVLRLWIVRFGQHPNRAFFDFFPTPAPVELVPVGRLRALKNHIAILTDNLVTTRVDSVSLRRWEDGMQEVLRELDGGEPDYRRIW